MATANERTTKPCDGAIAASLQAQLYPMDLDELRAKLEVHYRRRTDAKLDGSAVWKSIRLLCRRAHLVECPVRTILVTCVQARDSIGLSRPPPAQCCVPANPLLTVPSQLVEGDFKQQRTYFFKKQIPRKSGSSIFSNLLARVPVVQRVFVY